MKARSRTWTDWMQAVGLSLSALMLVGTVLAQDIMPDEESFEGPKKEYSPFADDHFPTRPLFGDTHLHTSWSADAGMLGGTLGPDTAYRSARGKTVDTRDGWRVKLPRPLDGIRRETLRCDNRERGADGHARACLHVTDLVHALGVCTP